MNILYATDGSEGATRAGRLLASLPLSREDKVTVLCAMTDPNWAATPPVGVEATLYPQFADLAEAMKSAANKTAEAAAAPLRERGVQVVTATDRHAPAEAILDRAAADNAALIVVGSHGIGALERFLIGSVSERVARHADCSVLVARGDGVRRAIVAVDDSESSEQALAALARIPLPADVEMTAVHVIRPSELHPPVPPVAELDWTGIAEQDNAQRREVGERMLERTRQHLKSASCVVNVDLRYGPAADELLAAARETQADLIVVGAANHSALGRLFLGSVSGRILSHASCSVLVARSSEAATA